MRLIISLIVSIFLLPGVSFAASKARDVKDGNLLYNKAQFDEALGKYTSALKADPDSDIVNFNLGTALYKKGDYPAAITHLNKSLLGEDQALRQRAQYNLGNSFYKAGLAKEEKKIQEAIDSLIQSISHYGEALKLDAKDTDAQHNLEFVKKELERLKKKQEQQKKDQQNKDGNSQKNDQKQKKDGSQDQEKQSDSKDQQQDKSSEGNQQKQPPQGGQQKPDNADQNKQKEGNGEDQQKSQDQSQQKDGQDGQNEYNQKKDAQEQAGESGKDGKSGDGDPASAQSGSAENAKPGSMTKQEVEALINTYQQNEEPKGLLNLQPHTGSARPVVKDW